MQAILVQALPATNHKPARYRVSCSARTIIASKRYEEREEDKHAIEMCFLLGWEPNLVSGQLPNGDMVYTMDHETNRVTA